MAEFLALVNHVLLFLILYAEVFLLIAFLESKETAPGTNIPESSLPTVTILVPCFNEEKTVAGTLRSLLALNYPTHKLSIIAINDGSTDRTLEALHAFSDEPRITVITKQNGGKFTALNAGLASAQGEVIGVLDADSFVAEHALRTAITRLVLENASAVTPGLIVSNPHTILGLVQQAEYTLSLFMRKAFATADAVLVTPGPFSLYRREVLETLGGWRHAHGSEDLEIAWRMKEQHMRIINAPDAHVLTTAPRTIPKLYTQRVRWTYGFLMNAWDYRHIIGNSRYGALGTLVVPAAILSVFAVLYFTVFMMLTAFEHLYTSVLQIEAAGFSFTFPELFFLNTTSLALLAYILVALALTLLFTGRSIARSPLHPLAVPLYLLCYSFLAPLWLFGAVARVGLRTPAPWR